jgi:hypothetical protein
LLVEAVELLGVELGPARGDGLPGEEADDLVLVLLEDLEELEGAPGRGLRARLMTPMPRVTQKGEVVFFA